MSDSVLSPGTQIAKEPDVVDEAARKPVPDRLEPSLFSFIFSHSLLQQFGLLAVTILSFPILYISLELPKTIMDDAIRGAEGAAVELLGFSFTRVEFLWLLCLGLLVAVLANGLIKMKINTWKGVVGERLLRRLRYRLITHVMRFAPGGDHKQRQGELVSMITSEVEPLGGIMGDALAQPVFQAGQMMTILGFLYIQNFWLGVAATATIPVQATIIPILQRRINLLHRQRVLTVRELADHISDTAQALPDLRANGAVPWTLAGFSARLGRLFEIRFEIYQKKFFMKFLNNMIGNFTPLTFYAIGGYLVIQGELSVGALVVALAAYKDIADPWRELLTYINQVQESILRYETLSDRFNRKDLLEAELVVNEIGGPLPDNGTVEFRDVTVEGFGGDHLLCGLSFRLEHGKTYGLEVPDTTERKVLAHLFVREKMMKEGQILLGGEDQASMHQSRLAKTVGLATSEPALTKGSIVENIQMSMRRIPAHGTGSDIDHAEEADEALASGNFPYFQDEGWVNYELAGVSDEDGFYKWWSDLIEAMEVTDVLARRAFEFRIEPENRIASVLMGHQEEIRRMLEEADAFSLFTPFDSRAYHPGLAVGENLLFAVADADPASSEFKVENNLIKMIDDLGLANEMRAVSLDLLSILMEVFGSTGPDHPLFARLTGISSDDFNDLKRVKGNLDAQGFDRLAAADREVLQALPFKVTAEQFGEAFPEEMRKRILRSRLEYLASTSGCDIEDYTALVPGQWNSNLTVLENMVFGRVRQHDEASVNRLKDILLDILQKLGRREQFVSLNILAPVAYGGGNLQRETRERIALIRAAIKRPRILVLEGAISTYDPEARRRIVRKLKTLLPDTTLIAIEPRFGDWTIYDQVLQITNGKLVEDGEAQEVTEAGESPALADLEHKRRLLAKVDAFRQLGESQVRLLAYASSWIEKKPGEAFFVNGDSPDFAYVIKTGKAEIRWPGHDDVGGAVAEVHPGRLIGDLSVFQGTPRDLELYAVEDCIALQIGARELDEIIRSDITIALTILDTVSGHLTDMSHRMRALSESTRQD